MRLRGAKENRSKNSLSKRGCKFKTFLVKVTFICKFIKNHFDSYSFAFSLAFKQRLGQLGNSLFWGILTHNRGTERPTGGMDGQNCNIQKLNEYNNRLLSSNLSEKCS